MIYDLTIIGLKPNRFGPVMPRLADEVAQATRGGRLLGCFSCDFGVLNRFAVLTGYEDMAALAADRQRMAESKNPFGIGEHLASLERAAYTPLPFMPAIEPGAYGPFYEIRTYGVGFGGMQKLSDAWAKVIERRQEMSKLLMVMESIESVPPSIVHIWPYKSLDDRARVRAEAGRIGLWPPAGGSDDLLSLKSELFVAQPFSPLS